MFSKLSSSALQCEHVPSLPSLTLYASMHDPHPKICLQHFEKLTGGLATSLHTKQLNTLLNSFLNLNQYIPFRNPSMSLRVENCTTTIFSMVSFKAVKFFKIESITINVRENGAQKYFYTLTP